MARNTGEEMTLGKNIAEARKAIGLTQEQLAADVGVSKVTVARWETGAREPTLKNIYQLAARLPVTAGQLLDGQPERMTVSDWAEGLVTVLRSFELRLDRLEASE